MSRILRDADLQPHRQQMYLTSHDNEFREKRADVLRVYYETPKNEHIVCVDEKTGIQALERRYADIAMEPGHPVRREFEYIRHGTLCWMGALDVRRGKPFGFASRGHDSDTFIELLDVIDGSTSTRAGTRHFTPKHASWLAPDRVLVLDPQSSRSCTWFVHIDRRPRGEDRCLRGLVPRGRPTLSLVVPPEVVVVRFRSRVRGRARSEAAGEDRRPDELQRGR